MRDIDTRGIIFNIQKYSVHDGEGIRTLVFLKGCPFACPWCANPESQKFAPERAFNSTRCLSVEKCGRCAKVCKTGALEVKDGLLVFNRQKCATCGKCVSVCPGGAQLIYGQEVSVAEVLKKVQEDEVFYSRSSGGLTLSGGECLAQADFALALLRESKRLGLHTAIETEGCCKPETLLEACKSLNTLIYDFKHIDAAKHKEWIGRSNELSINNLKLAAKAFPDLHIIVRTPIIPGFNDEAETVRAIRNELPDHPHLDYELLDYHRLGLAKYEYLGRKYALEDARCDPQLMKTLRAVLAEPGSKTT